MSFKLSATRNHCIDGFALQPKEPLVGFGPDRGHTQCRIHNCSAVIDRCLLWTNWGGRLDSEFMFVKGVAGKSVW